MSWLRLDDGFAEHPKIASLTDRQLRVWMRTLCYCARQEDPSIDRLAIKEVSGLTPRFISKCVSLSLLDRVGKTYEIHDWIVYQPKDKTGAERQARYRARRQEQAETARNATVTPTVTETVTPNRDENVTSRADAHARTRPLKDGTYALDVAPDEGAPPSSTPEATTPANGYTDADIALLQAAEKWVRAEGANLDATKLYRRLVDDFGVKWPDEQLRLVDLAHQNR